MEDQSALDRKYFGKNPDVNVVTCELASDFQFALDINPTECKQ